MSHAIPRYIGPFAIFILYMAMVLNVFENRAIYYACPSLYALATIS
jgi:hypothetical protein